MCVRERENCKLLAILRAYIPTRVSLDIRGGFECTCVHASPGRLQQKRGGRYTHTHRGVATEFDLRVSTPDTFSSSPPPPSPNERARMPTGETRGEKGYWGEGGGEERYHCVIKFGNYFSQIVRAASTMRVYFVSLRSRDALCAPKVSRDDARANAMQGTRVCISRGTLIFE